MTYLSDIISPCCLGVVFAEDCRLAVLVQEGRHSHASRLLFLSHWLYLRLGLELWIFKNKAFLLWIANESYFLFEFDCDHGSFFCWFWIVQVLPCERFVSVIRKNILMIVIVSAIMRNYLFDPIFRT